MERRREFAAATTNLQAESYLEREHNARWAALGVAHATSGITANHVLTLLLPRSILARGQTLQAKEYELEAVVFLGHGQRGDGDNFWKVIADSLVEAGVIHSDGAVTSWILRKRRDRENPRTEICVGAI